MMKIPVIVLVVFSLAFAGFAAAATPKKRTRNANRVGPYGAAVVGMTRYTDDASQNEQGLINVIDGSGFPSQNLSASTSNTDIGYQATFGYRFTRFFAAELGLVQYGELASTAKGDIDFGQGNGFEPVSVKLAFNVGGPLFSAVGIWPINDKFELFGRIGYLFASSDREFSSHAQGSSGVGGSAKGDSQEVVYGIGASYNINQVYSVRLEYQKLDNVGDPTRSGTENMDMLMIGATIRF
jgi:hypothetical protein